MLIFCFLGGCGGGILILNANTLLKVDGTLSANGQDGSSNSGGGAGGSIYVTTPEFDGTGTVEVYSSKIFHLFFHMLLFA